MELLRRLRFVFGQRTDQGMHSVPFVQQPFQHVAADKPSRAREKDLHRGDQGSGIRSSRQTVYGNPDFRRKPMQAKEFPITVLMWYKLSFSLYVPASRAWRLQPGKRPLPFLCLLQADARPNSRRARSGIELPGGG